ncbi:MAG: hypothetical protein EXR55_01835 [Dehalococcoidia bacterium]|nr:hypothetical protein [Dehalococcoidia bacterium]
MGWRHPLPTRLLRRPDVIGTPRNDNLRPSFSARTPGELMDFQFTPEQAAFREEAARWIKENLPPGWEGQEGDPESPENIQVAREFRKRLAAKGWLALGWPKEYGGSTGRNADPMAQVVFDEVCASLDAPVLDDSSQPLGETLITYGTEQQKSVWLKGIAEGRWLWAQLYSEPGAGSDLASLQTTAVEEGDEFVINGSKTWNSAYIGADMGFLLARTSTDTPRHRGISLLLVDLKSPGIQVSKLPLMGGGHRGLVYLDNVRVPKANLVGERDRGWSIALALLDRERSSVAQAARCQRLLERLIALGKEVPGPDGRPVASNPVMRHRLAQAATEVEILRVLGYQVTWMQGQGYIATNEASICKVLGAEVLQKVALIGMQMIGLYQNLDAKERWAPLRGQVASLYWSAFTESVSGGTSEINRNIIATRGLGLPRG